MYCPNCGYAASTDHDRCRRCNYKLPATGMPGAAPAPNGIICWNCAAQNSANHSRCTCCNARLDKVPRRSHPLTLNAYRHGQQQEH